MHPKVKDQLEPGTVELIEETEYVEIDIAGWWVIWEKDFPPDPIAVFRDKEEAETFHRILYRSDRYEVRQVARK